MKLKPTNKDFPFVSVVVAARNEEDNIRNCIKSLKNIDYPKDKYEIIIVNDRSTDLTKQIIEEEITNFNNFRLVNIQEYSNPKINGKAFALSNGIKEAKGEIIMTTDADCFVPSGWIKEAVKYFDNETALVCGFTMLEGVNFFTKLQAMDWLYLESISSASAGMNNALSCLGNNLAMNKNIYDSVGGYEQLKFSVTEDLTLLNTIQKQKKYKVKYPIIPNGYVLSKACANLKELYRQKKRWFRGGTGINILGYAIGFLMLNVNLLMLLGYLFLPIIIYFSLIFIKILSDFIISFPLAKSLKTLHIYKYFLPFQLYFMLYGLLLPFTFLSGYKIKWKDRKF
ncbi:MAG: glycosyltransferase [Ignavibacteria bacterium]|nr:glycosyltransferase [Ignavibacteria bacterium]